MFDTVVVGGGDTAPLAVASGGRVGLHRWEKLLAGKPDHYPPDSVTLDPQTAIYVVRTAEGFFALSAICTHLGCLTAYKPDLGIIACPCHGSKFNKNGVKIEGPAPRPLPWLRMWLSDEGDLMVDRSNAIAIKQLVRV